jgi:hypothetical protein
MAIIKKIGSAVLGVAIAVGCIGKFDPVLFMSLPFPLSIILWVGTGHSMPPCEWNRNIVDCKIVLIIHPHFV